MGIVVVRRIAELGVGSVLAPERFDPRRRSGTSRGKMLGDVVELVVDSCSPSGLPAGGSALVLDTTHAREGFVFAWHAPVGPRDVGSAKRRLAPGDVIVSRLRPYLRQIAFVDPALFARLPGGNAVLASTEFYVLRGKAGFDAAAVVPYLLSAEVQSVLAAAQEGGHHPRVSRETIASLAIPAALVEGADEIGARVRSLAATVRAGLSAASALVEEVSALATAPRRRR